MIITKLQLTFESSWQEDSKTPPTLDTVIHYLPLRGKFRGSINEHECSYFYIYSNKIQIISLQMRIEHINPNSKSQSEMKSLICVKEFHSLLFRVHLYTVPQPNSTEGTSTNCSKLYINTPIYWNKETSTPRSRQQSRKSVSPQRGQAQLLQN